MLTDRFWDVYSTSRIWKMSGSAASLHKMHTRGLLACCYSKGGTFPNRRTVFPPFTVFQLSVSPAVQCKHDIFVSVLLCLGMAAHFFGSTNRSKCPYISLLGPARATKIDLGTKSSGPSAVEHTVATPLHYVLSSTSSNQHISQPWIVIWSFW